MSVTVKGGVSGIDADVGSLFKSLKVEIVPPEIGLYGSYAVDWVTGSMAAGLAAAAPFFAFRWTDAVKMAMIRHIRFGLRATTGFTQGNVFIEAVVARGWTVADSGGTVVTPTADTGKMKQSMAPSSVNEVRIASTATLTAGTRTLDALPFATYLADSGAVVKPALGLAPDLWMQDPGHWPLVLGVNEGIILRATVPATGVWIGSVHMEWDEVPNF